MKNKYLEMDINIAFSMLNMKLRDNYSSLEELCDDEEIEMTELVEELGKKGIIYDKKLNRFSQE